VTPSGVIADDRACPGVQESQTHLGAAGHRAGAAEALRELAGVRASGSGWSGRVHEKRDFGCVDVSGVVATSVDAR
jgi:hypothetical protein